MTIWMDMLVTFVAGVGLIAALGITAGIVRLLVWLFTAQR